jgi:toxin ParE1/3/4
MTSLKPVLRRTQVEQDVADAIAYYLEQDAPDAAEGFVNSLEKSIEHIRRFPASGSPRYAGELGLPDLRFWQIRHYPYLVFYVEQSDYIDVWRILNSHRDIVAWLQEPE